jgi:hypothetical protein
MISYICIRIGKSLGTALDRTKEAALFLLKSSQKLLKKVLAMPSLGLIRIGQMPPPQGRPYSNQYGGGSFVAATKQVTTGEGTS